MPAFKERGKHWGQIAKSLALKHFPRDQATKPPKQLQPKTIALSVFKVLI
jgi:hypothetical protein